MRCLDFRLAADARPVGAAALSPRLKEHLDGCPGCLHWEEERARWGDLGSFFREEAPSGDIRVLRSRVRSAVLGLARPRTVWLRPAFGTLASGLLVTIALVGTLHEAGRSTQPSPAGVDQGSSKAPEASGVSVLVTTTPGPSQQGIAGTQGSMSSRHSLSRPAASVVRPLPTNGAVQPLERNSDNPPAEEFRVVRVGDDFGIEWPTDGHGSHRVVRSSNPADFSSGAELLVRGSRWVDSAREASGSSVQYYLID